MLVLNREIDEAVILTVPPSTTPQRIELLVVRLREGSVRLGFTADRSVKTNRGEIQDLIDAERGAE